MTRTRPVIRLSAIWLLVTMALVLFIPAIPDAFSAPLRVTFDASPTADSGSDESTGDETGVRLPAGPAIDEGSSGPNVRARTDQRGSDQIPEAPAAEASPVSTKDESVPRLDDPVLRWLPEIMTAAEAWRVPPEILAGIIRIESQGEPGPISPAGARGLVQMMPDGLINHGLPESLWHDPAKNIDAGAWGLAWRFAAQGSWAGAVGAYLGFGCDVYGTCTDVYVTAVLGWADYYRPIIADPRNSGFAILPGDWAYGPIVIFQMPTPPTPESPPNTPTPSPTAKPDNPTKTPEPGKPTATSEPTKADQPTDVPPTATIPTEAPTTVPTEPPVPTEQPTEPPVPTEAPLPTEPPPSPNV